MKIIGVTGKSGAGKSTFANFLGERKNVGVIHLDNVLNRIKEDKLKKQIKGRDKNNTPRVLTDKMRRFINSHKISFRLSMLIKKLLMKKRIDEQIRAFKIDGKDAVVIEGIHLAYMTDPKMYNSLIYVRRNFRKREKAITERDGISKAEIVERDIPFKRKFSSVKTSNFDYVIDNGFGKEELKAASQKIYDEVVGIKTFDERYVVKEQNLTPLRNIVRVVGKTGKNAKRSFIRE